MGWSVDPLHIIGELVLDCLRQSNELIIIQYDDETHLCRITLPDRDNWKGPRTFRGRGPLPDAALAAWSEAANALRSQPRAARRPQA
jgi:hypothetical protein